MKNIIDSLKLKEAQQITDLDDPDATVIHSQIIKQKRFLYNVYRDFYTKFASALEPLEKTKTVVELGSGGGFIKEIIGNAITSDILRIPTVDLTFSGTQIPFKDNSLDAFLMIDVLHHIKDPVIFIKEMDRCLRTNGRILMIEPANTLWARFIWKNFHHEKFDTSTGWRIEGEGPMSDANGAIPWIIFCRDRKKFEEEFPSLDVEHVKAHTPLRYLISGGLSIKQLLPAFCYPLIKMIEFICIPLNRLLGMFYFIDIKKKA